MLGSDWRSAGCCASTANSDEAQFTETEAKIVEQVIKRLNNKASPNNKE